MSQNINSLLIRRKEKRRRKIVWKFADFGTFSTGGPFFYCTKLCELFSSFSYVYIVKTYGCWWWWFFESNEIRPFSPLLFALDIPTPGVTLYINVVKITTSISTRTTTTSKIINIIANNRYKIYKNKIRKTKLN